MRDSIREIRNKWFINRVKEIEAGGTPQVEIAKKLGVVPQYLSPILSGKRNASEKFVLKFCEIFSINPNDLYSQIGAPVGLMTDEEIATQDREVEQGICKVSGDDHPSQKGIPLIPIDAMAGVAAGSFQIMEHECERYVVPMFKGAEFLISVSGDSMTPKYTSGDLVACKSLPLDDLFFQWNNVYVIDTRQGAILKRIRKAADPDRVMIVSENPNYEPFELHKSQINAVAIVVGVIRSE